MKPMSRKGREVETLLLAMFAALPLYLTQAIGAAPLIVFHAVMAGMVARTIWGKGPELIPAKVMRFLAIAYVPFYAIDAAVISRSAIAASTHLVLFIALYQPTEAMQRNNQAQRLLTTGLIFIASLATSTHITIVLFVIAFSLVMFRQMMYVSHMETVRAIGRPYQEAPSGRAAIFYLAGATVIGALLFPLLPRVRNPLVPGMGGSLSGATTGLSDTINFNEPRVSSPDATLVARVWMNAETRPFFSPVRLRGTVYDHYANGEWQQTERGLRHIPQRGGGSFIIGRSGGTDRVARVELRPIKGKIFIPVGTYAIDGLPNLYEGPARDTYFTFQIRNEGVNYDARMSMETEPLRLERMPTSGYPVTPQVAALARQVVGNETDWEKQAALIERWMVREFRYVADPGELGQSTMSVDQFLLRTRAGHCEYFAAGMVALLTALDVPARVAGGFYGGRPNPLNGFYAIRREDAHAWTEVWNGSRWMTFDSTPPALRPGSGQANPIGAWLGAIGDSITYFWDRYVLTFGLADQVALFTDLITRTRDALATARARALAGVRPALIGLGVLMAVAAIVLLVLRRRRPLFALLADQLRARGIKVGPAMTMEEALALLREEQPDAARELAPLIALYEEERFSARVDPTRRRELRRRLAEL